MTAIFTTTSLAHQFCYDGSRVRLKYFMMDERSIRLCYEVEFSMPRVCLLLPPNFTCCMRCCSCRDWNTLHVHLASLHYSCNSFQTDSIGFDLIYVPYALVLMRLIRQVLCRRYDMIQEIRPIDVTYSLYMTWRGFRLFLISLLSSMSLFLLYLGY